MNILAKILNLTKQLYPKGRAFKMPLSSSFEMLHVALNMSEERAYSSCLSTLDAILPDTDKFTEDDATEWERRYGIITNISNSLEDRKQAIRQKINHPGSVKTRENFRYIEGQLRLAGFDVYIFENRFPDGSGGYETKTPFEVLGSVVSPFQFGDVQLGDTQMGGTFTNKIVNNIDESDDSIFSTGENLKSTFFIGGQVLGDIADVPSSRKNEFRQLILRLKPVQTVGYLFVNFT